jgi:hypothetical protein
MPKDRPTTRDERKAKSPTTLPSRFVPRFWEDTDKRQTHVRLIRDRIKELQKQCNADSIQKKLLVERAVFIALQCQTIELDAYEGRDVELSRISCHAQLANALSGLLTKLGLDKHTLEEAITLQEYVARKDKKS